MIGAIIGDMVGSLYENENVKDKRIFFLTEYSYPTDDTIMTLAISRALEDFSLGSDYGIKTKELENEFYEDCIKWMDYYGETFPDVGYGSRFNNWLKSDIKEPYNSWGNGSAMRVSPVGWYCDSLDDTLRIARLTALPTHNHPEGIKGAQAIAASVFLLRTGKSKEELKDYIEKTFEYDLSRKLDDIRPTYTFHVSCQKSVPEAIIAFLESNSYEDAIRNAVSIGGDSDTIACMTGALAEAYYPIPRNILDSALHNIKKFPMLTHRDFKFYETTVLYKKPKDRKNEKFRI